ncbi:sensor histidine kinase, partial [Salmonella sp. SAL4357]|uniref:sensor histidine kinase n=1 Tax=Salmonella sp. SAL4357 TaxID=3159878 RepID=UPI00397DFFB8
IDLDKRQLSRINRLIDDMLDISRIRNAKLSIQKEKFSLVTLLDDICDRFGPQLESAGCALHRNYKEDCEVHADSYRIEQVIMN